MSTNSLILLSPDVELNFSPLECGLNLVTYFQRIEYRKGKKIEPSHWRKLTNTIFTTFVAVKSLSCVQLCNPKNCSTSGFPILHHLLGFAQILVHWVGDAIQPSHPLSPLSPPALNLSQHQGLFQWIDSLHQVAKVLELQHQSFQWPFRVDFL